jgi:hypothetical protein
MLYVIKRRSGHLGVWDGGIINSNYIISTLLLLVKYAVTTMIFISEIQVQ